MAELRIAINTTCAIAGGAITHLKHLLPALAEQLSGERVFLLGDSEAQKRIQPPSCFEWIDLPTTRGGFAGRLWQENVQVSKLLRSLGADVLFHPGNFAIFSSPIPQVILIHNLAPFLDEIIQEESLLQRLRLGLLRMLTNVSLRRVARAIFISSWGRDLVLGPRQIDPSRYPVIPFGAEHLAPDQSRTVLEQWGVSPDQFVLSVSHIYRYKRLEKLIDAYVEMGDRVRDWPLLIVGEPFDLLYTRQLKEKAERSIAPIIFTGGLDSASVGSLMSFSRAFVFTSEAENLPITLLEAMSAGSPIVTNRHCSMPEVCADCGRLRGTTTALRTARSWTVCCTMMLLARSFVSERSEGLRNSVGGKPLTRLSNCCAMLRESIDRSLLVQSDELHDVGQSGSIS